MSETETESTEARRPDRRRRTVAVVAVVALLGALAAVAVGLTSPTPPARVTAVKVPPVATVAPETPPAGTVGMIADQFDPAVAPFPAVTHSNVGKCAATDGGCHEGSWTVSNPVGWSVTASRGDAVTDTTTRDFTLALAVPAGVYCPAVVEAIVDGSGRDRKVITTGTWTRAAGSTVIMCHAGSATWRQSASQVITWHAVGVKAGEIAKLTVNSLPVNTGVLTATASVDGRPVGSVTNRVTQPPAACAANLADVSDAAFLACAQLVRAGVAPGTIVVPSAPARYVATVSSPRGTIARQEWTVPAGTVPKGPSAAPTGPAVAAYLAAWLRSHRPATSGEYRVTVDRWDSLVATTGDGHVYASSASQIRAATETATQPWTAPAVPVVHVSTGSSWVPWAVGTGLALISLLALLWLVAGRRRRRTPEGDDSITG